MDRLGENELKRVLLAGYKKYPLSQASDMLKLIFQNEFGCGHMAPDTSASLEMISREADALAENALSGDSFDYIGNGICRLHLRLLRQSSLTPETLNAFFLYTANQQKGSAESFEKKVSVLLGLCKSKIIPTQADKVWQLYEKIRMSGYPAVRHSQQFRAEYAPAYRVVLKRFCDYLPLFCKIDALQQQNKRLIVAIDGNSAAGKSSLAALLKSIYSCHVFPMDHFFLRPEQRTSDRLSEAGGNIDYERFEEEVIGPLKSGTQFTYRPYDCRTGQLSAPISISPSPINIIEGAYSLHPRFGGAHDIKVFLSVDETEQRHRLLGRSANLYDRFIHEWIPMEDKYFECFEVRRKCDLVFDTGASENAT